MYKVIGTLDGKSSKTDDPRRGYPIYIYIYCYSHAEKCAHKRFLAPYVYIL